MLLADRIAVVTGGGGGIGAGIVDSLAEHGAHVAVVDRDHDAAQRVAEQVRRRGRRSVAIAQDVTADGAAERIVASVTDELGGLDILVNNVGHYLRGGRPFHETAEPDWEALRDVNLTHVMRLCHAATPTLIEGGPTSSIINLTTVEATRAIPLQAAYGAYKAALAHFTRCLALELSEHGVRVNAIAPDVTRSQQLPYDDWLSDEELERVADWVPLGRFGEPADVGGVAVFLASELSAFVTGASIPVDGGTGIAGGWYRSRHAPRGWTNRPHDA